MNGGSVLVANRGEIACRIIRTARRLGLRTVAVFSDPDRGAPHVRMADEAVRLGSTPPRESYLLADRIIAAALDTGAGAIHPGYGLLSEDAAFAGAVEEAGLTWVGPTPRQLGLFGAKDAARALAREAGVPLLAGTGALASVADAIDAAERLGYPVMLKATAGGGGIGVAPCQDPRELTQAYERVARLATASFGSGDVFLERLVRRARHVEVQVFGDGRGRVLTLGDRDCTLQRRNQKVIEEAPAPGLSTELRERLADAATALCANARYRSAGTVEFIYDRERDQPWFLEVNARLQVEHTVTEERYGIDLVEWMLRLAAGDESMFDDPPKPDAGGVRHVVQARVYAEDPAASHLPSAGTITAASPPDGVRVDGWIETGTEVTSAYDPLLAKLIAGGATRTEALRRLRAAVEQTTISGIRTNLGLLSPALRHSVGSVDYTGDLPILLGPDGPSLGGFVCPATVPTGERWKLGQLRPGDTVRFQRTGERDNGILGTLERNRQLGTYTNFCNPLDLSAAAVPAGHADGGCFGVTLFAPAFHDRVVAELGRRLATGPR